MNLLIKDMKKMNLKSKLFFITVKFIFFISQPTWGWGVDFSQTSDGALKPQISDNSELHDDIYKTTLEQAKLTGFYHFEILEIEGNKIVLFGEENHHTATDEQLLMAAKVIDLFPYRAAEFAQDKMSGEDAQYLMSIFRGLGKMADFFIDYSKTYYKPWSETSIISYALTRGTTLTSLNEVLYNGLYVGDLNSDFSINFFPQRIIYLENQLNINELSKKIYENINVVSKTRIQTPKGRLEDFGRVNPTKSNRLFFIQPFQDITIAVEYGDMNKWQDWPHNSFRKFSSPDGVSLRDYRMAENIVLLSLKLNSLKVPLFFVAATAHVKYIASLLRNQKFVKEVLASEAAPGFNGMDSSPL